MQNILSKPISYLSAFAACLVMSFATGCASGGYKLTRDYARWINGQNIVIRVILYILTSFVFVITLLIDAVFYNTMDFWEGRVSAGDYQFKDGARTFQVRHEILENNLKRSTIKILDSEKNTSQEVVFSQTNDNKIEVYLDGKLRGTVNNINELPVASTYDVKGNLESQTMVFSAVSTAGNTLQNVIK